MSRRAFDPSVREWMDLDQPVTAELEKDLANLVTLNRLFGSHTLVLRFLRSRLTRDRCWRILDLATGSADIPRAIAAWARRNGLDVQIDAVDAQPSTVAIARKLSEGFSNISISEADILTFDPGTTWDVVLCSLALHHFSDHDATSILRRMAFLGTHHVFASDLRRSGLATFSIDLLTTVWMREEMTRNDARLSARRAFSFRELHALAVAAGWKNFQHIRAFCFRQALTMDFSFPRNVSPR